jgi:uncharacterized protein YciI
MFIVLLKFTDNKSRASEFMTAHNEWIQQGFDEGIFLMVGSLDVGQGGAILAQHGNLEDLKSRLSNDPFVKENVVIPEIIQITPSRTDERLNFLHG